MESTGNYEDDLDKQILEELKKQTPWNKITKKLHVSPGRIANVKAKHLSSQTSVNDAEISAKAFQLFEMGKDPVQTTIELKQPPELILKLYDLWIQMKEQSKAQDEKLNESYQKEYDAGYRDGYNKALKRRRFLIECSKCGQPMYVEITDEAFKRLVKPWFYETFNICHEDCGESMGRNLIREMNARASSDADSPLSSEE